MPFLENPLFPASCLVSFDHSISSDHAALFLDLPLITPPPTPPSQIGWLIEDQMEQDWKTAFAQFPCPLIDDILSLMQASEDLIHLTNTTCGKFFSKKMSHSPKGLAWWNEACAITAADVSRAHGPERHCLSTVLRATL